jgi:hypothetical protein
MEGGDMEVLVGVDASLLDKLLDEPILRFAVVFNFVMVMIWKHIDRKKLYSSQ